MFPTTVFFKKRSSWTSVLPLSLHAGVILFVLRNAKYKQNERRAICLFVRTESQSNSVLTDSPASTYELLSELYFFFFFQSARKLPLGSVALMSHSTGSCNGDKHLNGRHFSYYVYNNMQFTNQLWWIRCSLLVYTQTYSAEWNWLYTTLMRTHITTRNNNSCCFLRSEFKRDNKDSSIRSRPKSKSFKGVRDIARNSHFCFLNLKNTLIFSDSNVNSNILFRCIAYCCNCLYTNHVLYFK